MNKKTQVDDQKPPKSLKQLKSVHSLDKILPKLAEISAPLRPLLNLNIDFTWTLALDDTFEQLK